jgi:hypothetical protein
MSALPPVPNTLKVTFNHLLESGRTVGSRVWFLYTPATLSVGDLTAFASSVEASWSTNLKPLTRTATTLSSIVVVDANSTGGAAYTLTVGTAGTLSSTPVPSSTAAMVNHKINRRYRGGKPRTYWPWGGETQFATESTWTTAFINSVTSGYGAFITAMKAYSTGALTIVTDANVSFYQGFTEQPYGTPTKYRRVPTLRSSPVIDAIVSSSLSGTLGSQRRRLRAG